MVNVKGYASPSSKQKYFIVETEDETPLTKLLVQAPLTGRYSKPWPVLSNSLHLANWTLECNPRSNLSSRMWSLQAPNHHRMNIASTLPSLGRRIIQGDIRWGDTVTFDGEFRYVPRYWEWCEDVLSRSQQALSMARIYDAVYASLFTYDRNSNILEAFCEAWCPKTNTLLTSIGELSISLWDLHALGGLPIAGSLYEEVVPEVAELTGVDSSMQRFVPRSCEYLFSAFHYLKEGSKDNQRVPVSKWIDFWCKRASRYGPAPPRREQKARRLTRTHNPSGAIVEATKWSSAEEATFSKLGVRVEKKADTYLAAFLSCWLCIFVLPSEEGNFIRPGTLKMASLMASGRKVSLAVPVLASIYHGLNNVSRSSRLDHVRFCFPIHYVYGWLAYYFKAHYVLVKGPSIPFMVAYSGEGAARYFTKEDARKHIHQGTNAVWTSTMLTSSKPYYYVDSEGAPELESSFFMSIRFNYLPLRCGNSFIIEPYSPHRFARQFGFYQKIPGALVEDIRTASLTDGLKYWRICMLNRSLSRATFPSSAVNVKKLFGADYTAWWKKTHGSFFDDYLPLLVTDAEPITATPLEDALEEVPKRKVCVPGDKNSSPLDNHDETVPILNKRMPQDESDSSDRCWKRKKVPSNRPENVSKELTATHGLDIVEVHDSVGSPERTLTTLLKKPNDVGVLVVPRQERPQVSGESIVGPDSRKLSAANEEQEVFSIPHGGSRKTSSHILNKQPSIVMSVFEGRKLVQNVRKKYVADLWDGLQKKLSSIDINFASSHEEDIQVVLAAMEGKDVDISPLRNLLHSFIEFATSYDKERSNVSSKHVEPECSEKFSKFGEHLSLCMFEEDEKVEELSFIRQSLKNIEEKLDKLREEEKNLKVLLKTAEREAEDAKLRALTAKEEYEMICKTADDSVNLEKKKDLLEASRQDLVDYKLCLD